MEGERGITELLLTEQDVIPPAEVSIGPVFSLFVCFKIFKIYLFKT